VVDEGAVQLAGRIGVMPRERSELIRCLYFLLVTAWELEVGSVDPTLAPPHPAEEKGKKTGWMKGWATGEGAGRGERPKTSFYTQRYLQQ
jgi:hypothetical protein